MRAVIFLDLDREQRILVPVDSVKSVRPTTPRDDEPASIVYLPNWQIVVPGSLEDVARALGWEVVEPVMLQEGIK